MCSFADMTVLEVKFKMGKFLYSVVVWFWCSTVCLQVIWNTSLSWSRGDCWRCWLTNTSGPAKKQSASLTSFFPCWSLFQRKEPRPQSACATPGSPSSGHLQLSNLPSLPPPPETATDHFPVWAYQMDIYFSLFFLLFLVRCFEFLMFLFLS